MKWSIGGRSAATAGTTLHCAAQLWNPSSTRPIWVTAISIAKTVATVDNPRLSRTSARGATPTSTVTPTIASDYERKISPPSAAVLELATFGTQPTIDGVPLFKWNNPAAVGSAVIIPFGEKSDGICILPGAGLAINTVEAVILQPMDVTFFIYE